MEFNDIVKISLRGFLILIIGSMVSVGVLVYLLYNIEDIKNEQQTTENAHDSMYELKYHTERLLTTHNLTKEKELWKAKELTLDEELKELIKVHGKQSQEFNQLWNVIKTEINSIHKQLDNELFQIKNTMDKSLLRRLGEGLNTNEDSKYYIHLSKLNNSIEYLKQYETFFMDELAHLRKVHIKDINSRLKRAKVIALSLPGSILILTIFLAFYITSRVEKMEVHLIKVQKNLQKSLVELRENKETLHQLAYHDPLTSLPNRAMLLDRLNQSIKYAKRDNKMIAVLFIDLDNFKEINDSFGHSVGDELLYIVAKRFVKIMREEDTIARIGGDEFVVLLKDIASVDDISKISKKIINSLTKELVLNNHTLHITSSIGISIYSKDGESVEILLRNADSAMYKAKESGRNNFQFYTPEMTARSIELVEIEHQLRKAIINNELEVYYQPQILIDSSKVIGLEALVRWNHPVRGLLSPGIFLPTAEKTGLITQISSWVLEQTCKQLVSWQELDIPVVRVAVNLDASQLQQSNLPKIISSVLKRTKCSSNLLELEITEGFVMTDPEESIILLHKLNDMGINISIDDFGTGYSSMSYLKQLPIQKLKIDQAFIRDAVNNSKDRAIIRTIIALAKGLELDVIAEGVEELEQKELLAQEGCNKIQGYLYSRPIPAKEVEAILRKGFITI